MPKGVSGRHLASLSLKRQEVVQMSTADAFLFLGYRLIRHQKLPTDARANFIHAVQELREVGV